MSEKPGPVSKAMAHDILRSGVTESYALVSDGAALLETTLDALGAKFRRRTAVSAPNRRR